MHRATDGRLLGSWSVGLVSLLPESRAHVNVTASPSAPVVAHGISRAHRLQQRPCRRASINSTLHPCRAHETVDRNRRAKIFPRTRLNYLDADDRAAKKMRIWSLGGAVHERKEKPKLSVELTTKSKMAASRLIKQRGRKPRSPALSCQPVLRMPAAMPLMVMSSASRSLRLSSSRRSLRSTSTCSMLMGLRYASRLSISRRRLRLCAVSLLWPLTASTHRSVRASSRRSPAPTPRRSRATSISS